MIDFMAWSEVVDDLLKEGEVQNAALFDPSGARLAASQGVAISQQEAQGLLHSLKVPSNGLYALYLGGVKVSCMRLDDSTLIGRTSTEVFVAHRTHNVLICGYSSLEAKGSCLGSIKEFALKLNSTAQPSATSGGKVVPAAAGGSGSVVAIAPPPPSLI